MVCECSNCAVRGGDGCLLARRDLFVSLVQQMRDCQRNYFRTRSSVYLEKSKELERKVDAMIREFNDPQGRFF